MRQQQRKTRLALAASIFLLVGAGVVNQRLGAMARPNGEGDIPPTIHFASVFLGGFRGLITDGLWIRAAMLQEQGRFVELVQLANWITALEPEFPQVWALQAWNMAYNISVLMPDNDSRWQWIDNGLRLLRDRAIPATGTNPTICLELGQLFMYKIGGPANAQAHAYRQRWIQQVMQALDHSTPPEPDDFPTLQTTLAMNPGRMQTIEQIYGKIDWRQPESQTLYWAFTGLGMSTSPRTAIRCRRMIYQAMTTLFEQGKLTVEPEADVMVMATDFELLPGVLHAFDEALPMDPVAPEAYARFLQRATRQLATFGRHEQAQRCFQRLHQRFPSPETMAGYKAFTRQTVPIMPIIITTENESERQ